MRMFGVFLAIIFILTFSATGQCSECYTCISTRGSACMRPQKNNNASVLPRSPCGMAPSVTKLLRDVVPDVDDVFTVWPPSGNADCLRLNITLSTGENVIVRTCTNLGTATCPRLQSALTSSSSVRKVEDCSTCTGDLCNSATSLWALSTAATLFSALLIKFVQ